jgi:FtsP/CotA-like multicopper oxidase with cupredoxin domain
MRATKMKKTIAISKLFPVATMAMVLFLATSALASTPGISAAGGAAGTFNLTAQSAFLNQPDGAAVYAWGYGCVGGGSTPAPTVGSASFPNQNCPTMQVPGPTLVVTEGQIVTIILTNGLPAAAGNTSILFPGFQVCPGTISNVSLTNPAGTCTPATSGNGVPGLLTQEAAPGGAVSYQFVATTPGTHSYYSGTQGDLQIEMGLYGAIVVIPAADPTVCPAAQVALSSANVLVEQAHKESDFRLAHYAYDHCKTAYDREYLFQFSEMDPSIHTQALAQVTAAASCSAGAPCSLNVPTEPYRPGYFLVNGRSMPDDMDANYAAEYPHQPYNGNPHMHPGEQVLIRVIGQGRWQHPFHEHGNHVRILGRDGNLIVSQNDASELAGLLMFTTDTTPGQAFDGIFYWTGRGLNWDAYGHHAPFTPVQANQSMVATTLSAAITSTATTIQVGSVTKIQANENITIEKEVIFVVSISGTTLTVTRGVGGTTPALHASGVNVFVPNPNFNPNGNVFTTGESNESCNPDADGYYTVNSVPRAPVNAINYYEWCQDHNKPLEVAASGDIGSGGPATLPDPNIFTNGAWYSGSPYLGPDATDRATGPTSSFQPSNVQANPANERGYAFMWHSHNEREITTNNVFPGGMLMMMMVDSREFVIDESN